MTEQDIRSILDSCRLPAWEALPDFGLYMDQLITYTDKCFAALHGMITITPAMINNYVKVGLIDRPQGKKYTRDSVAQLLMLCQLKQTTTMETMKLLLHPDDGASTEQIYTGFIASHQQIIHDFSALQDASPMIYALQSASFQLICRMLLTGDE